MITTAKQRFNNWWDEQTGTTLERSAAYTAWMEQEKVKDQLKQTIEYLYDYYKSSGGQIDHVEDAIKELINK